MVQGTASIREVNRALGLELEEGHGLLDGGRALRGARRAPSRSAATRLTLEDGTVLEVLDATPRRVRTVRIHLPAQEEARPERRKGRYPKSRPLLRAIQDSNLWPLAPEANALSS